MADPLCCPGSMVFKLAAILLFWRFQYGSVLMVQAIFMTEPTIEELNAQYNAWYWNFIPHLRYVEDFQEDDDVLVASDSDRYSDKVVDIENITEVQSTQSLEREVNPVNYEFRDERDRKWWSFFNEYEYRYPKAVMESKNFWRWFDKGTSAAEKRLITKLDILIASFAIISYWAKYVDQANIGNAYVSGMKEDLHMYGDQYSNAIAMYNAGSVFFQIFYMYLFPRVSMHWMFCISDVVWSLITIATAFIGTSGHLYACRFFVGAAEAGYFMMIHYLLGSWYKPDELGRRGGLYYCGQMLGILTAGLLQAKIFETMDGLNGRAGWRWAFIIDGLITLPVGLFALYMVPGTPEKCYSLFLSDDEIRLARKRLKDANIKTPSKEPPAFFNKELWKKILSSWRIYVLAIMDALFWNSGHTSSNGFAIWLKSTKRYTIPQVNRLTTIPPALGVFFILAVCFSADFMRSRSKAIFWAEIMNFSSAVTLAIWNVSSTSKWYAFYVSYFNITISSVVYGWLNDIMRYDAQARAIVLCSCNIFANQSIAWISRLTFPTSHGPEFKRGYTYASVISGVLAVWVWVTAAFYKNQERKDARKNGIVLYNTKTGDIPADVSKWLDEDGNLKPFIIKSTGKNGVVTLEVDNLEKSSNESVQ